MTDDQAAPLPPGVAAAARILRAFDAWFAQNFPDVTDDETRFDRGEIWDAWNAGRAEGAAAEREACDVLVTQAEDYVRHDVPELIADAAAAEREACAQLAEQHNATYSPGFTMTYPPGPTGVRFADLIRARTTP